MEEEKSIIEIPRELTVNQVVEQVDKVKSLMQAVMKDGEHYGVIPGTKKPSLYKPGAEKLGTLFRLRPEYKTEEHGGLEIRGHREYVVVCKLIHIPSGQEVGQGCGSCSTMESKYRYRHEDQIVGAVPKEYWDLRGDNPQGAQALIGVGNRTKKIDGQWAIVRAGERIENPDIADVYNTCWKMACKRAHVAAMLTACAASDIFTQDLEDFQGRQEVKGEVVGEKPIAEPPKEEKEPQETQRKLAEETHKTGGAIAEAKKRGRLSKEELLTRSESVAKLMLENDTIDQTEFDQMAKHTTQISEDYQQLYDSYKALCLKYKKELKELDPKQEEKPIATPDPVPDPDPDSPTGELYW